MDILAVAGVDERGVVVGCLRLPPAVEGLIDDEHADGVAGVEEGAGGGIMGGADEVEAGVLHQADLADLGGIEGHSPEDAVVVMDTGAVDEQRHIVELKAIT